MKVSKEKVTALIDWLHGSGINGEWHFKETKRTFRVSNYYHCMNEDGYYDGMADFTLIFPKKADMIDFKLQFNGRYAQYLNGRYMLREYLEDTTVEVIKFQLTED